MSVVTDRDLALFESLGKYGMLTSGQIARRVFLGVQHSTVLRRLRTLEHAKLIYRIRALESGECVWILGREGETRAGLDARMIRPNRNGIEHDVMLVDLRMKLEALGLGQNFVPEWIIRRQTFNPRTQDDHEPRLVPDGIFSAMIWKKEVRTFAIELELNPKTTRRYQKLFTEYRLQEHLDLVWYFVRSQSFGQSLAVKWDEVSQQKLRWRFDPLGSAAGYFSETGGTCDLRTQPQTA